MSVAETLAGLGAEITAAAAGAVLSSAVALDELTLSAERARILELMTLLREKFGFEQCMDITAVDRPENAERFELVWNLLSLSRNVRLRVTCTTDAETPVASVCGIWASATWWEREAWDMFGIVFDGQPDLRRLLTDYGFEGHPLRKDFPLTGYVELRYDENQKRVVYEPVKLTQDFRNFDFLSPWEGMTSLPGDEKAS
jgi:NADH-quinone oxidoreductase subunit C